VELKFSISISLSVCLSVCLSLQERLADIDIEHVLLGMMNSREIGLSFRRPISSVLSFFSKKIGLYDHHVPPFHILSSKLIFTARAIVLMSFEAI
jgi:hypothetical protein